MQRFIAVLLSSFLSLPMLIQFSWAAEANHNAAVYNSAEDCLHALGSSSDSTSSPIVEDSSEHLDSNDIKLLSWNVKKGLNAGWKSDLQRLTKEVQLVLLQEAVLIDEMKQTQNGTVYWSFSPGYQTARYNSGIMTLSKTQPDLLCSLQKNEPWLTTPKVASITRFQFNNSTQALLLVNIHQVNFTLGLRAFTQQLADISKVLEAHQGPVILSGDFNTWKNSRLNVLEDVTSTLGLSPTSFSPDYRKVMFGHPLDHIFTRGFDLIDSFTVQVETSDHNPLIITLSLKKA